MKAPEHSLDGMVAVDPAGQRVGKILGRYPDVAGSKGWALISPGLLRDEVLVPMAGAEMEGNTVHVAFSKEQILSAPTVLPGGVPELVDDLVRHYATTNPAIYSPKAEEELQARGATQAEVIRSEERLQITRERQPVERVRLRKRIVTEYVTQTIPVQREVVEIEQIREPDVPLDEHAEHVGAEVAEGVYELILYKEVPVIGKRVVPVERVRMRVLAHTEEVTVTEQLRSEKVEFLRGDEVVVPDPVQQ